jgi:hypothetical protein
MQMRRIAVCLVVLVLGGGLAACGGGGAGTDASVSIETLQLAAANTQAAESFRVTFSHHGAHDSMALDIEGTGVQSADGSRAQLTVSMGELGEFEVRKIDDAVYVKLGDGLGRLLDTDKPWVRIDAADGAALGSDLFDMSGVGAPTTALEYLEDLTGNVENLGEDSVAGRPATHYRATLDSGEPIDVWIDGNDRVVKVAVEHESTGVTKAEASDFGVPVDVEAPPADEVVDFADVFGDFADVFGDRGIDI